MLAFSFSGTSCGEGDQAEFNFNEYVNPDQKFSILQYELRSIYNLTLERFGLKKVDDNKVKIKKIIHERIRDNNLDFYFDVVFPLPEFTLGSSPKLLLLSPRNKIERLDELLLINDLSDDEIVSLETEIELNTNYSAIIINIGGIAAYPSIIKSSESQINILKTASHEWLHQYLIMFPLGRAYFKDENLRTVNETLANIFSEQIVKEGCNERYEYFLKDCHKSNGIELVKNKFDYRDFMKNLRIQVDKLLIKGDLREAEILMKESSGTLRSKGFNIRRINQAWFAFHGSYADAPGSLSNVDKDLENFINSKGSIGLAIKDLRKIKNYNHYNKLLGINQ